MVVYLRKSWKLATDHVNFTWLFLNLLMLCVMHEYIMLASFISIVVGQMVTPNLIKNRYSTLLAIDQMKRATSPTWFIYTTAEKLNNHLLCCSISHFIHFEKKKLFSSSCGWLLLSGFGLFFLKMFIHSLFCYNKLYYVTSLLLWIVNCPIGNVFK